VLEKTCCLLNEKVEFLLSGIATLYLWFKSWNDP